jgi:hypothetical protein
MPEPISSACLPPSLSSEVEPLLSCDSTSTTAAPPLGANVCVGPDHEQDVSASIPSAVQTLSSQYLRTDYSKLIAAATPSAASTPPAPQTFFATKHGPGDQFQPELGASRTHFQETLDGVHLKGTLDVLTAGLHLGSLNDDGSRGENVGAAATLVGVEVTAEYRGYSFTFGESVSLGAGVSSGEERDIDGDGIRERCFKGSLGPLTLGFCDEL